MPGHTHTSPETLARLIGAPDAPLLIDVCLDEDFALDPRLIPGARRRPFAEIAGAAAAAEGRPVVVICQKGLKLSQGGAAVLRANGVAATYLTEGMVGWTERGLPTVPFLHCQNKGWSQTRPRPTMRSARFG